MHLPEIAIEVALLEGDCALCWLRHRNLIRRVDALFNEHITDPQWRQSLREGNGFCVQHAELILSRAHVLSLAIIAEDMLAVAPHSFAGNRLGGQTRCQLCDASEHDIARAAKLLAELLREPEWRARYAQSAGLCVPHLQKVVCVAPPDVRQWLLGNESQRWYNLRLQLQEVIRKHDYRFHHEPWGDEIGSWQRAIHKLYGVSAKEVPDER